MAQRKVFQQELGSRLASREPGTKSRQNASKHGCASIALAARNSKPINHHGVFATHRLTRGNFLEHRFG